jgi:RHS repeat-associated protein
MKPASESTLINDSATDLGAAGFGLMFYNARWVDPVTGRFVQADSIIAYVTDPQSWDRYAYTLNNPVRYIDPSGYCTGDPWDPDDPDADCWEMIRTLESTYKNIHIFDDLAWTYNELVALWKALQEHPFITSILSARSINVYRRDYKFNEFDNIGAWTQPLGDGEYNLFIYDVAFYADPAVNTRGRVSGSPRNVEGVILHELTHIAMGQNSSILKEYQEKFPKNTFRSFGYAYNFSLCDDQDCKDSEIIAMAVTASLLVPFDGGREDQILVWMGGFSSENPIQGVCYGYR